MNTVYRGYVLSMEEGVVVAISLNEEELDGEPTNLEDAIQWIEEDIRCRENEEGDRVYLSIGDPIYCDGGLGHIGPVTGAEREDIVKFDKWCPDGNFYNDGLEVNFDQNGKAYILP